MTVWVALSKMSGVTSPIEAGTAHVCVILLEPLSSTLIVFASGVEATMKGESGTSAKP